VAWTNKVNVTSYTNTITKTSGIDDWNGGASSTKSIPLGSDGYVQSVAVSRSYHTIFGLSDADNNQSYTDIDYAIHLQGNQGWPGDLVIFESGVEKHRISSTTGNPAYVAGDVLRVAVESGAVKYYKNDTLIYPSQTAPTTALVMDASVFHTGAKVKDAFLCRTRPQNTPQRTLYIGGLYEEELEAVPGGDSTNSTTPYTSYYSFGGKLVGMRRANYSTGNGQYRTVSDHLGSTTLLVNAAATPGVVSREYHKPYGEVAWSAGSAVMTNLTSIGYTGQRLDTDSGLMYYGARFYDPVLSSFVSADTVAPNPSAPGTRNRYSYVLNNPLGNVDPSGHEAHRTDDEATDNSNTQGDCGGAQSQNCANAEWTLINLGFKFERLSDWNHSELLLLLEAVGRLLRAANWDVEDFKEAMGIGSEESGRPRDYILMAKSPVDVPIGQTPDGRTLYNGMLTEGNMPGLPNRAIRITVFPIAFTNHPDGKETVHGYIHELAHVWDIAYSDTHNGETLSGNSPGGDTESWAESVGAAAYPESRPGYDIEHPDRLAYVRTKFSQASYCDRTGLCGRYTGDGGWPKR
jgi:RHS repeat-associated protein